MVSSIGSNPPSWLFIFQASVVFRLACEHIYKNIMNIETSEMTVSVEWRVRLKFTTPCHWSHHPTQDRSQSNWTWLREDDYCKSLPEVVIFSISLHLLGFLDGFHSCVPLNVVWKAVVSKLDMCHSNHLALWSCTCQGCS